MIYEVSGAYRDLTLNTLELKRNCGKREYFVAFDNRPLVQLVNYIKWSKASIKQIKLEQKRYKDELKKLIDSKECCREKFYFLEFDGKHSARRKDSDTISWTSIIYIEGDFKKIGLIANKVYSILNCIFFLVKTQIIRTPK